MAAHLRLSADEKIRHTNIFSVQVCAQRILQYLLSLEVGPSTQSYKDCLVEKYKRKNNVKQVSNEELQRKYCLQVNKLDTTDARDFEVSLCSVLLLAFYEVSDRTRGSPDILLSKIVQLKNHRNSIMYETTRAAVDPGMYNKVKDLLREILEETTSLYSLPQEIVNNEIEKVVNLYRDHCSSDHCVIYALTLLPTKGRSEAQKKFEKLYKEETLIVRNKRFQSQSVCRSPHVMLRVRKFSASYLSEDVIPFSQLLNNDKQMHIVVSGPDGSGKSTLFKTITREFYNSCQRELNCLEDFDIVVQIFLRDETKVKLSDVFNAHFGTTLENVPAAAVKQAIFQLRTLFLLKGYDEVNDQSSLILEELLQELPGTQCRAIITTRPHGSYALTRLMKNNFSDAWQCQIEKIFKVEHQIKFLQQYHSHINGTTTTELFESFRALKSHVREMFTEPILLILFCELFMTVPDSIRTWNSKFDTARTIKEFYEAQAFDRLVSVTILNKKLLVSYIFKVIEELALSGITKRQDIFWDKDIEAISDRCVDASSAASVIKVQDVLSVVLKSNKDLKERTYEYHHKSLQEYFAAAAVVRQLQDNNTSLLDILIADSDHMSR